MGKLNMEAMKNKLDAESSQSYNAEYDKLQQGKNVRRVLWPKGDSDSFYSEGMLHFGLGTDGKSVVTCPKTFSSKEKCPVCEYVEGLMKSKNKNDKKLADDIKAKRRIYINVINRDDEEETPKVLPIGVTILKGILETICDLDYGDITDPETGRDITITKKGQGMKTEYAVLPKPKASPVSESSSAEEIEEEMTDLNALFIRKSYEEIESVLNGDDDEEDEDSDDEEDEDESSASKSKSTKSKSKSESSEDNDEDEESGGDYDELELDELIDICSDRDIKIPAKPTKMKLIALLEAADKEEDTDYDASKSKKRSTHDDDEEDEKPAKKKSEPEDKDDVQDAIAAALERRKNKK